MEQQEKKHPLSELMKTTMEHIQAMADANTVIGDPIHAEGVTLIPVSRLSIGVAGGGTEFSTKKQAAGGTPSAAAVGPAPSWSRWPF